jgi:exosortase
MSSAKSVGATLVLLAASFLWLYHYVIVRMVRDWKTDDNYSHGFLIVPLAIYFAWERRTALRRLGAAPSAWGLPIVLGSIAVLLAGFLGAELFLTRISIIGVIAGGVIFVLGWKALWTLAFPIGFLLLMIPIPAIIFNEIAFPLQLLASRVAEVTLETLRIPVLREGNIIILANATLEIAEACSGIRSLISLLTLGIVYGYFMDPRIGIRLCLAASTVPIAVVANAARVAGTGIAAHYYGEEAALGFFHTFSGWIVFVVAFVILVAVAGALLRVLPGPRPAVPLPAAAA